MAEGDARGLEQARIAELKVPAQLAFPFGARTAMGRDDFIVAPCNEQAIRFIERWPDWPARAAAIWGPRESGKTHLANIWCARAGGQLISGAQLRSIDGGNLAPELSLAVELDDLGPDLERDRVLLALFERPAGSLLFTARRPPAEWIATIADLRSRFDSLLAFPVWEPDESLLSGIVRKQFSDRQLEVDENLIRRLLAHVERTPHAVSAFVARIDEKALAEKRAVTERLVMELIELEKDG